MVKCILYLTVFFVFSSCLQNNKNCDSCKLEHQEHPDIVFAQNFSLDKTNESYTLRILHPDNGKIIETIKFQPDSSLKVISLISTTNGMLSVLHLQNNIVGISGIDYVYNHQIKKLFEEKKITSFGDESSILLEKIIASKAGLILYSGFGDHFPHQEKLEKLGITIIPIYDWRENHPLGKLEWIKLIGAIFGKEKEAVQYFNQTVDSYYGLKEKTKTISGKPQTIAGSMIGDTWYAPGGDSYFATLLKDAGTDYVYKNTKGTASITKTIEEILNENSKSEYWINPGKPTKKEILTFVPQAKHLPCFENGVYCYSKNGQKFWEEGIVKPHLLLKDLIEIFHPSLITEEKLYFYSKIE